MSGENRAAVRVRRALRWFGVPMAFCLAGYIILFLAFAPLWDYVSAGLGFLASADAPSFDRDLSVSYDPERAARMRAAMAAAGVDHVRGSDIDFPRAGERYGLVSCPDVGLEAPVYWYDSDEILLFGAGQSLCSLPPGYGTAVVLSGHNSTFFAPLADIEVGDMVRFSTNWGDYDYRVKGIEVMYELDFDAYIGQKCLQDEEELIMYTCYPFHIMSSRKVERYVVVAERVAGPEVRWRED